MSSDELRTVLRERAEVTDALGPAARVDAVHGRVRSVVRRRRRAAVAVAAAAAVVVAGASVVPTLLPRPAPNPADQKAPVVLAGRTVPKTQTAAGFSYHYVKGVESRPGAAQLRLTVNAEKAPKLVMWATSDTSSDPVVRLYSNVGEHFRSDPGGFERYIMVGPGLSERLTLTQTQAAPHHRLALAVYALDSTPPPGVTNGVVTFRQTILDDRLVRGLIGKPGQTDLRTTIDAVHGSIRISDLCYGAGRQSHVHVSFNGQEAIATSCSPQSDYDPGVNGASFTAGQNPLPNQGPVRVHVWLTGKHGSPPSAGSRSVIGFGLYQLNGATFRLAGSNIPVRQEAGGHEYVRTQSFQSRPGSRAVTVRVRPSDVPRLVTTASNGHGTKNTTVQLYVGGAPDASYENWAGASWGSGYVIQPGESPKLTFRLTHGDPGNAVLGIALSDQVH